MSSNDTDVKGKDGWSASLYNTNASFVYSKQYTSAVVSLLDPKPGERILDFGCGTGEVSKGLAAIVGKDGLVVGTDMSANLVRDQRMLCLANQAPKIAKQLDKARHNGLQNVFEGDIQDLQWPAALEHYKGKFDAVFTNAVLHWCKTNPAGVIKSAREALKSDGQARFVGEFGGFQNVSGLRSILHMILETKGLDPKKLDPWYFPSVDEYKKLLEAGGFEVSHISIHPRITPLPGPLIDWMRTFCRDSMLGGLSDEAAEEVMQAAQTKSAVDMQDSDGNWAIMYVRLRFVAIRPSQAV